MAEFLKVFPDGALRPTPTPTAQRKSSFESSHLEVRMFNVGRGEAILVIPPTGGNAWLIDCGCHDNKELGEAIAEFLRDENLSLKGVILSHPHTSRPRRRRARSHVRGRPRFEGLHLNRRLNKDKREGGFRYRG